MSIRPTLVTTALAGVLAAVAWPFLWVRFGAPAGSGDLELVLATLLVIALPAHALVVGFGGTPEAAQAASERRLDTALLKRVGAWLAAAGGEPALRSLARV